MRAATEVKGVKTMNGDILESSDSVRTARPLRHAKVVTFSEPLKLELDGVLPQVTVTYETYGLLNADKSNAVLICHALSGDSHVARHDERDDPGWWEIVVGPGKAIDTDKYFVICPNILGGCRGTTGPNSTNPRTGKAYGPDFPTITIGDMVEVQRRLVDYLDIPRLRSVIGGSMGGHQVLTWATKFPARLASAVPIATSPRLTSQALAFDVVGRNAIQQDPHFRGGQYYEQGAVPSVGLAIARMIGHITYLSPEAMKQKFEADRLKPRDVPTEFEKKFSVGSYLGYQGAKFVERFDANSYMRLSMAMDLFDLGATREQLANRFRDSACRWLVISFTSDWLFPPEQSQQIVSALVAIDKPVSYCNVHSSCGHDAFLLEDDLASYGGLIREFLANADNAHEHRIEKEEDAYGASSTSIFHPRRLDYDTMMELVPPSASVLDLGCGQGSLLLRLKARGNRRLMGVELDEQAMLMCVHRGLDVVQADLNRTPLPLRDKQFDCVVLSQTLQTIRDVQAVVDEMLRIGRQCIVSFPNFGYHKLRKIISDEGRMPESPGQLRFKWYNTPNIRFLTIADFEEFCREKAIRIHQRVALDTEAGAEAAGDDPNFKADLAIFVISR